MLRMLTHACYPGTQEGDRRSPKPALTQQASCQQKLLGPYLKRKLKKKEEEENKITKKSITLTIN